MSKIVVAVAIALCRWPAPQVANERRGQSAERRGDHGDQAVPDDLEMGLHQLRTLSDKDSTDVINNTPSRTK